MKSGSKGHENGIRPHEVQLTNTDGECLAASSLAGQEALQWRIHGDSSLPRLIYLPGLHGDWSFIGRFRNAIKDRVSLIEFSYPQTTHWSLEDYSAAIHSALGKIEVESGFLLAESFGSQVAWAMLNHAATDASPRVAEDSFKIRGIILAGGFVRHPFMPEVQAAAILLRCAPVSLIRLVFRLYRLGWRDGQRWNSRESPGAKQRLLNCTVADRCAMVHRLQLILENDPRPVASVTRVPVFQLSGGFVRSNRASVACAALVERKLLQLSSGKDGGAGRSQRSRDGCATRGGPYRGMDFGIVSR